MRERTKTRAEQQRLGLIGRVKQFHITMVLFSSAKTGEKNRFLICKKNSKNSLISILDAKNTQNISVGTLCFF